MRGKDCLGSGEEGKIKEPGMRGGVDLGLSWALHKWGGEWDRAMNGLSRGEGVFVDC